MTSEGWTANPSLFSFRSFLFCLPPCSCIERMAKFGKCRMSQTLVQWFSNQPHTKSHEHKTHHFLTDDVWIALHLLKGRPIDTGATWAGWRWIQYRHVQWLGRLRWHARNVPQELGFHCDCILPTGCTFNSVQFWIRHATKNNTFCFSHVQLKAKSVFPRTEKKIVKVSTF